MGRASTSKQTRLPTLPGARARQRRELVAIVLAVLIGGVAVGAGYLVTNFSRLIPLFAQPTPIPTLKAQDALDQIQKVYAGGFVHVTSPLFDETDLLTDSQTSFGTTLTPPFATKILSLYLRGYPNQPIWRWIDRNTAARMITVFEVHSTELWVITMPMGTCIPQWQIWAITPQAIIQRGIVGDTYANRTASHPESGTPPGFSVTC